MLRTQMLLHKFEVQHGCINFRNLIRHDLSTAKGFAEAKETKIFANICSQLVKSVVANFLELDNPQQQGNCF